MTHGCINDAADTNEEGDTHMKAANSSNYGGITPIPLIHDDQDMALVNEPLI